MPYSLIVLSTLHPYLLRWVCLASLHYTPPIGPSQLLIGSIVPTIHLTRACQWAHSGIAPAEYTENIVDMVVTRLLLSCRKTLCGRTG
jgi:hypothetical protein